MRPRAIGTGHCRRLRVQSSFQQSDMAIDFEAQPMKFDQESPEDKDKLAGVLFAPPTGLCTNSLAIFVREHRQIFKFLFFSASLAAFQDEGRLRAARALAFRGSEEDQKKLEMVEKNKDAVFKQLQSFSRLQSEVMCIRLVDNFLCYVSDLTQLCMKARPEILRSSEMVKVEDILKLSSLDEIVEFLVERKVNELSYGGTKELNSFFSNRFGFELWTSQEERNLLTVAVELRNIYTHNRGIINRIFMGKLKGADVPFQFTLGKRFPAEFDDIVLMANNMFVIACRVDALAADKFAIDLLKFS
jgi:hypothetical protein